MRQNLIDCVFLSLSEKIFAYKIGQELVSIPIYFFCRFSEDIIANNVFDLILNWSFSIGDEAQQEESFDLGRFGLNNCHNALSNLLQKSMEVEINPWDYFASLNPIETQWTYPQSVENYLSGGHTSLF